jgi:hypothetical protein
MAAAQSWGWAATAMYTPGMLLKDQTASGRPVCRQARDGSVVVNALSDPTYWAVPPGGGGAIGLSGTLTPSHVPLEMNPVPAGAVGGVVVVGPVE